jgi:hypothetical protein
MIKRFLADLYVAWRTLEGLPVAPPYSEAKQGHVHHDEPNRAGRPLPSNQPEGEANVQQG